MNKNKAFVAILLIASMFLGSCATVNSAMGDMGQKEKVGTVGGAVVGAGLGGWLGKRFGGNTGAIAGVLIGGAIGGYFGNQLGASFDARDKRLAKIKADTGIDIQRSTYPTLSKKDKPTFEAKIKGMNEKDKQKAYQSQAIYKAVVPAQFASGSSKLTPKMKSFFYDVAKAYKKDGIRKVMIVGHADSQGDARMNQRLSESRAKAVAQAFMSVGYPSSGIYYQGAGESEPIADNSSPKGRAENRRVEVIDAGTSQGLAMAKRYSIAESHAVMKDVKSKIPLVKAKAVVAVAKNLSGTDSILPFHGELYNGQQLLESGHKVAVAEKPTGFFSSISTALNKAAGSLVGTAHASGEQSIPLFLNDDLAIAGKIKRLDGKSKSLFAPSDHLPAYYNQPIYTYLDGNAFFSLQPVSVLKEEALANQMPNMIVYKRYDGKGDKADAKLQGIARLYVSGDNMLYRWKANDSGVKKTGILGLDIILPKFSEASFNKTHTEYLNAQAYYMEQGKVQVDQIKLKIKIKKDTKIDWSL
ncbi:OmpA family protein [Mariprofundus ferrooxydans]|nr:OmpA family protein [Mariprofundus ferrooxydans]